MRGENAVAWTLWGTMALVFVLAASSSISPRICEASVFTEALARQEATWCAEFWLDRYQTLIAGLLAIAAAALASLFAWKQLQGLKIQSAVMTRDVLLRRRKEVEERMQECDKVLASITSGFNSQLYQDSLEDGSWDSSPVNRIWANEAESQVDAAIATLDLQQQLGQDEETVELARAVAISQGRIVAGCFNRAYPVNADTH